MNKISAIILLCMGMTCSSSAQQFLNKRNSFNSYSSVLTGVVCRGDKYYCSSVVVDSNNAFIRFGNKFIAFDSNADVTIDSLYQRNDRNIFSWNNSLQTLADKNFLLAAESLDTAYYFAMLLKYDSLGNILNVKEIPKPFCNSRNWYKVTDIKPVENNCLLMLSRISCAMPGGNLQHDIVLSKLDSNFNVIWHKQYGATSMDDAGWKLLIESDGYLIAGGRNNLSQTSMNFSLRAMLMKTDTAGNVQWTWLSDPSKKTFEAKDVIRTQDGGYVYCGSGDGYEILGANGTWSIPRFRGWVEKLDSNRNVVWSRAFNDFYDGTEFKKVIEAPDGRLFLFGNKLYADTTIGSVYIKTHIQGWFLTLSASGDSLRERLYSGIHADKDRNIIYDAEQTSDGGFIMVGEATDQSIGLIPPAQRGWIVKVDSNGCLGPGDPQCWPTAVPEIQPMVSKTKVYPNPVHDQLTVTYNNKMDNGSLFQVADVTGRKVLEQNLEGASGQKLIDVRKLQPGVYLYKIIENGAISLQGKFVKQ